MTMKKQKKTMVGKMIGMGITNLVGVGLIGATATGVAAMPAGTAKTLAGNIPALQSVALMSENLKLVSGSKSKKGKNIDWGL